MGLFSLATSDTLMSLSWKEVLYKSDYNHSWFKLVGRDGVLVESITFNWRVMGSTPALAAT